MTDPTPIHAWLHPWLPLLSVLLEPLYPKIRYKLAICLQVSKNNLRGSTPSSLPLIPTPHPYPCPLIPTPAPSSLPPHPYPLITSPYHFPSSLTPSSLPLIPTPHPYPSSLPRQAWHPQDDSARAILAPWKDVFLPSDMSSFLSRTILPKLAGVLREFTINPRMQVTHVPRICIPSYPGYASLHTPDIHHFIPRIFIPSYPGYSFLHTPDMHPFIPRIFITSYPGYSFLHTPDIHPFVPRIFIPSYPGYSSLRTPDIHPFVPRIFIPSYFGLIQKLEPFRWTMAWRTMLPFSDFLQLFDKEFFPKFLRVLCEWLSSPSPDYEEIQHWYCDPRLRLLMLLLLLIILTNAIIIIITTTILLLTN